MGLKAGEFWDLSFLEFDLLRRRYELQEYRRWEQTASLMCMVYNVHRGKHQRMLKVKDILKNPYERKQTPQDMARFLEQLTKTQGGRVDGN